MAGRAELFHLMGVSMSGLEDNDSEPVEMQPGEQVSNRKALALVTSGVSGRADCRFHKERKRIQKGLGLGQLGGCVPLKNKAALMCFPAGPAQECGLLSPASIREFEASISKGKIHQLRIKQEGKIYR